MVTITCAGDRFGMRGLPDQVPEVDPTARDTSSRSASARRRGSDRGSRPPVTGSACAALNGSSAASTMAVASGSSNSRYSVSPAIRPRQNSPRPATRRSSSSARSGSGRMVTSAWRTARVSCRGVAQAAVSVSRPSVRASSPSWHTGSTVRENRASAAPAPTVTTPAVNASTSPDRTGTADDSATTVRSARSRGAASGSSEASQSR